MHNINKHHNVPAEWSLHLTEQPPTESSSKPHVSNLSPSAIIQQAPNDDEQFTLNILKNRLSEVTTLRNSSNHWRDANDIEKSIAPLQQHQQAREPSSSHLQDDRQSQQGTHVWWVAEHDQDGLYSICGLLFVFGFLFPPFWWIGSIWPKHVREKGGKMAERWQKLNRIMSIGFSSILIILIVVFVILYATGVY